MRSLLGLIVMLLAAPVSADYLVPLRTIRPAEIIGPSDLVLKNGEVAGAMVDMADVVGLEARVVLYPGRPVLPGDVGPPAVVGRGFFMQLSFDGDVEAFRAEFVAFLADVGAEAVLEFPTPDDQMVKRLLKNKREGTHDDYTATVLERALDEHFDVVERTTLPSGTRILYHLTPR